VIGDFRNYFITKQLALVLIGLLLITPCYSGEPGSGNETTVSSTLQDRTLPGRAFVPGDAVSISTLPDTTSFLNGIFSIDDRGFVELPVYGKAKISHMTEEEFANFVRENFKDYLRFPDIQVKPMIRLSVLGGVPRPGLYYFDANRSLWEVLYDVGGTTDEDGLKQMRWKRSGKSVEDNLIPHLQNGISLRDLGFRTGDQIWVRTPGKPGTLEKARGYLSIVAAAAGLVTVYLTYQVLILERQ
jgi:protein involved in polysaccharide export with SLBB domain